MVTRSPLRTFNFTFERYKGTSAKILHERVKSRRDRRSASCAFRAVDPLAGFSDVL